MLWVGLILVVAAVVLFVLSKKSESKAFEMKATETSRVGDLQGLMAEIAADMPGGGGSGYSDFVELKGTIVCDQPVTGEMSNQPVALYETRVERQIETRREVRDSQGNVRTEWSKSTETVSSNRRDATFYLDDGTGRLRVRPEGADLQLETIVDRFEQPSAVEQGASLAIGGMRLAVGSGFGMSMGSDRRTIGYRFIERVLPIGRPLYALGEVADTDDGLVLRKPADKDKPFLLSLKSEEELVRSAESSAKWLRIGAVALGVGGIALAVIGAIG